MKKFATYLMTLRPAGSLFPAADAHHESWLRASYSVDNAAWRDSIG